MSKTDKEKQVRAQLQLLGKCALVDLQELTKAYKKKLDEDEKSQDLSHLFTTIHELSAIHDEIDEARKELFALEQLASMTIGPKALDSANLDKIGIPELERSFYPLTKYQASITDKASAFDWLRKRGADSLIFETVNSGTLAAYLHNAVKDENIEPPESIKFSSYKIISSSKYKPKASK